jgi:hypothetical protein
VARVMEELHAIAHSVSWSHQDSIICSVVPVGSFDASRTLIAARTACVLLTMPTTTDPCLTASDAYSTWKMRPWGENVTESLS